MWKDKNTIETEAAMALSSSPLFPLEIGDRVSYNKDFIKGVRLCLIPAGWVNPG